MQTKTPADECKSAGVAQPQWVKSGLRHFLFFLLFMQPVDLSGLNLKVRAESQVLFCSLRQDIATLGRLMKILHRVGLPLTFLFFPSLERHHNA